jgi:hypothetical protein
LGQRFRRITLPESGLGTVSQWVEEISGVKKAAKYPLNFLIVGTTRFSLSEQISLELLPNVKKS